MKTVYLQKSALDLIQLAISGKLNSDPIGQRPPTSQGYAKSEEIIRSLISGVGIGMITLRDISQDEEMQKIYPGVHYLVIDGGHRIRALVKFYQNKFPIGKKKFKELDLDLSQYQVALDVTTCTSQEAIEKFRNLNQTTPVNAMEMLMCDDQSEVCRAVRSLTRYYSEYKNEPHDLFESFEKHGVEKATFFDMAPNHRRKWDEYVFLAVIKANGGGNVAAGIPTFYDAVDQEYKGNNILNKTVLKNVERFLDDAHGFACERKPYKLNTDIFAAFQVVWFALYEKNKNFKIDDYKKFYESFLAAYSLLTGNADTTYNNKTIKFDGEIHLIKEFVRANMTNFSSAEKQKEVAKLLLAELSDNPADYGVIFRDSKRSLTTNEREQKLAIQGFKCAIDGEPLRLEDSVWGHDTAWAQGGELMDGAVIRKTHNRDMGTTTLDEYRMILNMRKGK